MMSAKNNTITQVLFNLGFNQEQVEIYLYLNKKGLSSVLQISKELFYNRTNVYRDLDTLLNAGLVEQVVGPRGFLYQASPHESIKNVIKKEEEHIDSIKDDLDDAISELSALSGLPIINKSCVKYFKGIEGLKQVTWNSLGADSNDDLATEKGRVDEICIYEMEDSMNSFLDAKFSEDFRRELVRRNITVKQITNHTKIEAFTRVRGVIDLHEIRYVPRSRLNLSYEVLIHGDIVTLYNFKRSQPICIEIHDKDLAKMQKSLFDFVWDAGRPLKFFNARGRAVLES